MLPATGQTTSSPSSKWRAAGHLILDAEAVIRENGGGVYVSGGTLVMNGGRINSNFGGTSSNTSGGDVYMEGGTFTMNGGEISNNEGPAYMSITAARSSGKAEPYPAMLRRAAAAACVSRMARSR
ncbi:MAG: hypothetical protein LBR86_00455 [Tannerella sp.]|jgi:hypothetical protein|nr:hypothetical protein [Tannerella sp.]